MEPRTPYQGVIEDVTKETEYQLVAGIVDLPTPRHTFWDNEIQYYQPDVSLVSCTIHGSATACSALTGHRFALEDLKRFWHLDLNLPTLAAKEGEGGYVTSAVDIIRNGFTLEPLVSYGIKLVSPEADDALNKGYMLVCSFGGDAQYSQDKSDGTLDLTNITGTPTYYHCLSLCLSKDDPTTITVIVDNYFPSANNTYKILRSHLPLLVKSNIFSNNAYVFAYKADLKQPASLVSSFSVNSVEKAKKHGITEWDAPQAIVANVVTEYVLFKLGLLTQVTGKGVSKERLIVALDRGHLLDNNPISP